MRKPLTFLASAAMVATMSMPLAAQDETAVDTVVATVGDVDITVGHMIAAQATLPEQYRELPTEVLFKGILDQLVQQTALQQSFDGDLPPRVDIQLENERRSLVAGEAINVIMSGDVDETDLEAAYQAEYADAEQGEEYNASHILVETQEEADAIKAELDEGADFEAVAREKSTGPTGPGGGSLGWFAQGTMVPEFETAVVEMEPGTVSDPVQTQFGWHVIKLNEKRLLEAPALEDVRDELELQLRQTRVQEEIERVTAEADVDRSGADAVDPEIIKQLDLLD